MNNKKIINGWAMYDWANSAFSLVISSTIFPIYYDKITHIGSSDLVRFFGREYVNTSLFAYSLSFSFLFIAFLAPLLSAIADYIGNKRLFMKFFCYMGGLSCISLFFFTQNTLEIGILSFVVANIGFSGSIVFYNAYLPEIASKDMQDRVSAKGFSYGYAGSVILLIFCLALLTKPAWFSLQDTSMAARISFALVGLWWIGFAQITFFTLPKSSEKTVSGKKNLLFKGYQELISVWKEFRHIRNLKFFLAGFFFNSIGVQTVMYLAANFGEKELKLSTDLLISTILVIQIVAIGGAYLFARLSAQIGNIRTLLLAIIVWIGICIGAYYVYTSVGFMIIAVFVGLVMGGIQSMSRSTYSKLLPKTEDHASYFSFYDFSEKIAIVLGTASFGLIEELTGSMRNSLFGLIVFFIAGFIFLMKIERKKADKSYL